MINHNASKGLYSSILNELYHPEALLISTKDGKVTTEAFRPEIILTHDLFGSTLSVELGDKILTINLESIINDIMEVEHENETLRSLS